MTIVWKMGALKKRRLTQYETSSTSFRVSLSVFLIAFSKASTKANAARDKGRRFGVIIEK